MIRLTDRTFSTTRAARFGLSNSVIQAQAQWVVLDRGLTNSRKEPSTSVIASTISFLRRRTGKKA